MNPKTRMELFTLLSEMLYEHEHNPRFDISVYLDLIEVLWLDAKGE